MTEDLSRNDTEDAGDQVADSGPDGESQGFTGAEGAEQLIGQASTMVGRPAPGETVEISAQPGQTYVLDFDPSQARALVEGDNLILVFEDGGQIVFENLVNLAQLEDSPSIQYAGADIIALLQAQGIIPGVFDSFDLIQPEPGQVILIQAELGQRFIITFDPALAQISVDGDNLIMTFSDGGQIVIAGLGSLADQPDAPLFSIAGNEITGGTLLGTAVAITSDESAPDATATLETAAGDDDPVGTGATQYSDDTGDVIDTIDGQGVIPPTDLEFDVPDTDPTDPIDVPNPPVAYGASVGAGEGVLVGIPGAEDTDGGFVYKFDVGEENDISDNIHGTDEEDGVTTAFTITSLPEFGVLVVDLGDDGTLDAVYGVTNTFITSATALPPGGIEISSDDAVYYFLPIEQVFANEEDGGLGGDSTSSTDSIVGSISVEFDYYTTDSSGLTSAESTLQVTFNATPTVLVTDGEVDEAALSDGSNPGSLNETDTGTFSIETFGDTLGTLTVGGVDVTGGGVVNGTYGVLTVTETGGAYSWSYTLSDNTTDHPDDTSTGTSEGIADEFGVTVTDSDGDVSAEDTLTVAILDDGPSAVTADHAWVANSGDAAGTGDLNFLGNVGADQSGDIKFDSALTGTLLMSSGGGAITSGAEDVFLKVSGDGHTLTAVADVDGDFGTTGDQTDVFTIELDPSGDSYTIDFDAVLDDGSGFVLDDFSAAPAGQNEWIGLDTDLVAGLPIDIDDPADPNQDSQDVLVTPTQIGGTVNTSSTDLGNANQWIDDGEGLRVNFVTDVRRQPLMDEKDAGGWEFDDHYTVSDFSFTVLQVQGGGTAAVIVSAYLDDADQDVGDNLTNVNIDDLNVIVTDAGGIDVTGSVTIWEFGDSVIIEGIEDDWNIEVIGDVEFSSITVENADGIDGATGSSFAIGEFGFDIATAGDPIDMDFDLVVSDEDGDTAAGTLAVTTVPDGGSIIVGTGADETLIGGTTDDTLTGNGGSDNLTGGAGTDTFIFAAGDGGATVALADLISDFEDGTDLIGLTGGLTFGDLTIDQSSDVVGDGTNDTVISVTAGGEILAVLDGITATIDGSDIAIV